MRFYRLIQQPGQRIHHEMFCRKMARIDNCEPHFFRRFRFVVLDVAGNDHIGALAVSRTDQLSTTAAADCNLANDGLFGADDPDGRTAERSLDCAHKRA